MSQYSVIAGQEVCKFDVSWINQTVLFWKIEADFLPLYLYLYIWI